MPNIYKWNRFIFYCKYFIFQKMTNGDNIFAVASSKICNNYDCIAECWC